MHPTSSSSAAGTDKNGTLLDVINLAEALRQERLFIGNERSSFYHLKDTLTQSCNTVNELSWICAQHRQNLKNLVLARPDTGLRISCQKANVLENTRFVDAHKAEGVKYQQVLAYINLFNFCYANPYQLAQLLAVGDHLTVAHSAGQRALLTPEHVAATSRAIATGLYGCALNSTDTRMVLQLLKHLIEIQIVTSENPRRMLRTGSCAFARFYHSLHESLFSAKMFLTVALNDAVMRVLIDDEFALELDPTKAAMNLPPTERLKRFGSEQDGPEYATKVKQYVQETTATLHKFVQKFIRSLSNSWCLFPATLRWLVKTMCYELKRQGKFDERCIYELLTDMVLINFICPAIVSPEIYGITDCPISENARSNLITIGQILQQMALLKYQAGDRKFQELFAKFELNEVSDLLTQLLEMESTPEPRVNELEHASGEVQRSNVLVAQGDLNLFVEYFRIVLSHDELSVSGETRRKLGDILGQLPDALQNLLTSPTPTTPNGGAAGVDRKTGLMHNLSKQTKQKLSKTLSLNAAGSFEEDNCPQYDPAVVLVIPVTIDQGAMELLSEEEVMCRAVNGPKSTRGRAGQDEEEDGELEEDENSEEHMTNAGNLMENGVGGTGNGGADDMAGDILSEQNVVELQRQQQGRGTENPEMIILKADRTKHFATMLNDDVSIGNTSDNLEAVSEAHSNHSVASSLDLDLEENDQNDNLSDMVSANVSGRGSPNISGRDTPSSQVTEGNEGGNQMQRSPALPAAKMLNKARSDIEDKFCKFEIKKLPAGDETVSIMSDTWSTDVLASDSETLDAGSDRDRQFSTPLIPASVILPGDNDFVAATLGNGALPAHCRGGGGMMMPGGGVGLGGGILNSSRNAYDISETQSESAWSMDVLASDSEKMAEIDTDDNQSIAARSDITDASSAPDAASYHNGSVGGNNIPDSPFYAAARSGGGVAGEGGGQHHHHHHHHHHRRNSGNAPESPAYNSKQRSNGESVFFGQRRSQGSEESSQSISGGGGGVFAGDRDDSRFMVALRRSGAGGETPAGLNQSFQNDGANHLPAGASAATAAVNNPFLTPHRSSGGSERTKKFYSARQQSSESNHSSIFDGDLKHESFDSWKETGGGGGGGGNRSSGGGGGNAKKGGKSSGNNSNKSHEDKENHNNGRGGGKGGHHHHHGKHGNYSGGGAGPSSSSGQGTAGRNGGGSSGGGSHKKTNESIIRTNSTLTNPFVVTAPESSSSSSGFDESTPVEHRTTSVEQRNASYDGRRNGMMQMTSQETVMRQQQTSSKSSSSMVVRNYENHEIIMRHSTDGSGGGGGGGDKGGTGSTTRGSSSSTTTSTKTTKMMTTSVVYRDNPVMGDLLGDLLGKEAREGDAVGDESLVQKTKALSLSGADQGKANGEVGKTYRNGLNLPNGTVTKAGKFTGAIPKSISFDATADKQHERKNYSHYGQEQHHAGGRDSSRNSGFLNKIRQGLKNSGRKNNKHGGGGGGGHNKGPQSSSSWDAFNNNASSNNNGGQQQSMPVNSAPGGGDVGNLIDIEDAEPLQLPTTPYQETSEDILAKYRRKVSTASSEANASDSTSGSRASSSFKSKNSSESDYRLSHNGDLLRLSGLPPVSSTDLFHFNNAKKKLRTVLSSADVHTSDFRCNSDNTFEFPLLVYLKIQMAQALNLDDLQQLAYVQEAIRCIMQMSANQRATLIGNIYNDMVQRQKYLKYLMRLRQGLLGALKSVERYEERLKRDRQMCNRHLVDCCVRLFMEKREGLVDELQRQFSELTQLGDEKIDLLEEFIVTLMVELEKSGMSEWQLADARISMERILLQRLYRQVMFPNDDADILRDQVLRDHIKKLAKVITPEHPKLSIPEEYLVEAPWWFAQQQILQISAYKTALEKVRCVARCILSIMNLLSMTSGRTPSADDLTPVLIFVLIKANPPYMLSTIQYVNCFLGEKLEGQDRYYWTQFCAAVQFIKTMMDYGN